jgi:cell shape-determining protein MreC
MSMMQKPKFEPRISLGNLLSIVTILATVGAAFVLTTERTKANAEDIREIRQAAELVETRLRLVEGVQQQIRAQIDGLSNNIKDVKDGQKELTALMRQVIMEVKR